MCLITSVINIVHKPDTQIIYWQNYAASCSIGTAPSALAECVCVWAFGAHTLAADAAMLTSATIVQTFRYSKSPYHRLWAWFGPHAQCTCTFIYRVSSMHSNAVFCLNAIHLLFLPELTRVYLLLSSIRFEHHMRGVCYAFVKFDRYKHILHIWRTGKQWYRRSQIGTISTKLHTR